MVLPIMAQLGIAFGINLPLGAWRKGQRKFTPIWFLAIHASIPLLIAMRTVLDLPAWILPPEVVLVILGQVLGARLPNHLRQACPADADTL